ALQVRFDPTGPHSVLLDREQIQAAQEDAYATLQRICDSMVHKIHAARRKFDRDMQQLITDLRTELVTACLDRAQLEQVLQLAILRDRKVKSDFIVRAPYVIDSALHVVSPIGSEDWKRLPKPQ